MKISTTAMSIRSAGSSRKTAVSPGGTAEPGSRSRHHRLRVDRPQTGCRARRRTADSLRRRDAPNALARWLRSTPGALALNRWEDAIVHPDVDLVIVATTNDALTPDRDRAAVEAGKHVLVEKPAARTVAELDRLIGAAERHRPQGQGGIQSPLSPSRFVRRDSSSTRVRSDH